MRTGQLVSTALYSMLPSTTSGRAKELFLQGLSDQNGMIPFGRIRERFGKTAGVATFSDVFQFQLASSDSLEDMWLRWLKLMKQVNVTSLEDDTRETLTIAGLEKAKERSLEQHLRLRAPQTCTVLCASVDQYLRTTVDSSSQPTPLEIGAAMSTCACCGKGGHEKARCRFRNAKWSNCGKTGHLRAMCRQREKSSGKSSPSSSSGKSSGKGGTSRGHTDKYYCCGQPSVSIFWWERKCSGCRVEPAELEEERALPSAQFSVPPSLSLPDPSSPLTPFLLPLTQRTTPPNTPNSHHPGHQCVGGVGSLPTLSKSPCCPKSDCFFNEN